VAGKQQFESAPVWCKLYMSLDRHMEELRVNLMTLLPEWGGSLDFLA